MATLLQKYEVQLNNVKWVDIVHPSKEDLVSLATMLSVPERILVNALNPDHLPKFESFNTTSVIYLRVIDPQKKPHAVNIQELTTKVTIIMHEDLVLTIHRMDPEFIVQLREECNKENCYTQKELIKSIVTSSLMTYDEPLTSLEHKSEDFEDRIFKSAKSRQIIREGYYIKRKASAFRKCLKFSLDILNALQNHPEFIWKDFQGLKENTERFLFYTEDVLENVTGLLNLHISISSQKTNEASYKTNEVMRVLTVFSIFFLPLNFLAGIYGMNFEHMPELKHPHGYTAVLLMMGFISLGIFIWVHRKGWLKEPEE